MPQERQVTAPISSPALIHQDLKYTTVFFFFFLSQGSKLAQYYMLHLYHLIVFWEEIPHFIGEKSTAQRG